MEFNRTAAFQMPPQRYTTCSLEHIVTAEAASGYHVLWWGHIGVLAAPRGKTWEKIPSVEHNRQEVDSSHAHQQTTECFILLLWQM